MSHESESAGSGPAGSQETGSQPIAAGKSSFDLVDAETLFGELELGPDTNLLDVGSGIGNYTLAAAERVGQGGSGRIYAVDLWREGIEALRDEAERRGIERIEAMVADVGREIPVEDGSIDVCLVATVLHDLVDEGFHEQTLQEIRRALKDGGKLAIVEFVKADGPPGPPGRVKLSPDEVDAIVRPFGFEPTAVHDLGPHHYLSIFVK